jgi:COMPASS component SWD1
MFRWKSRYLGLSNSYHCQNLCWTCTARHSCLVCSNQGFFSSFLHDFQALYPFADHQSSLSWSKDSRKLLTASGDCNVVVWNVATGIKAAHLRFEAPIINAQLHPRNKNICIVSSHLSDAMEINLDTLESVVIPIAQLGTSNTSPETQSSPAPQLSTDQTEISSSSNALTVSSGDSSSSNMQGVENGSLTQIEAAVDANSSQSGSVPQEKSSVIDNVKVQENVYSPVVIYSPDGEELFVGDSRGVVSILDANTKQVKRHLRVSASANASVKSLLVSSDQKWLLVNSSDRCIRIFNLIKYELHKELYDAVNRQQWKAMVFSPDCEHVLAGAAHRHEHKFFFFSVFNGRMLKNLEGPKEGILDIIWHPTQPIIVSVSTTGTMYVWGTHVDETWSSFTPGFIELEQNEEYIEREDEFDAYDDLDNVAPVPGAPIRKKPKFREPDTEEEIDVVTIDPSLDDTLDGEPSTNQDELIGLSTNVIPDKFLIQRNPSTISST